MMKPHAQTDLLTIQDVASRLSISQRTLFKLIAMGKFPQPIRFSRKLVRIRTMDLQLYIQNLSNPN